jgi:hypothetical protein
LRLLNAIYGIMAQEHGQATPAGAVLNEISDVAADAAIYLPFALILTIFNRGRASSRKRTGGRHDRRGDAAGVGVKPTRAWLRYLRAAP